MLARKKSRSRNDACCLLLLVMLTPLSKKGTVKPKFPGIKKSKSRFSWWVCTKQNSLSKVMEASSRQYYHAVSSTAEAARTLDLPATLLLLLHVVVLHLAGWRNAERRARNRAGRRVDDRDSVASTLSHRLVQLHVVLVAGRRRVERIRGGGEKE